MVGTRFRLHCWILSQLEGIARHEAAESWSLDLVHGAMSVHCAIILGEAVCTTPYSSGAVAARLSGVEYSTWDVDRSNDGQHELMLEVAAKHFKTRTHENGTCKRDLLKRRGRSPRCRDGGVVASLLVASQASA